METQAFWILLVFVVGYIFITLESYTRINKATIALMMAIICWVIQFMAAPVACEEGTLCLGHYIEEICQIVFFIFGALSVVEIISSHKGFNVLSDKIQTRSKRKMLWVTGLITFFLSAVLDNLTTTIVMITLIKKIIDKSEDRLLIGSGIVIAANAGGAWTPIGDVTTTMLWIGGQLTTFEIMRALFIPSIICVVTSYGLLHFKMRGNFEKEHTHLHKSDAEPYGRLVFYLGVSFLLFVPIFKVVTGLPPFMGMLLALSMLWLVTDIMHRNYEGRHHLRVPHALTKIDLAGTLFFLGILLCVAALDMTGILTSLAHWMDRVVGSPTVIAGALGLFSAVVDNVPLVAAAMGMYDFATFPPDHDFWKLVAYCAGTGGSILIVGSAAGVVFMGLEKVDFLWYLRKITPAATVGYVVGMLSYFLFY